MSHDADKVHFLFTVNDLFLLFIVEVGLNSGFVHDLNLILNETQSNLTVASLLGGLW